jgi:hypothetical protein
MVRDTNSRKTNTNVWDSFISLPIWLSVVELELEMAANSTFWKADHVKDRLGRRKKERPFWGTRI